MQTRKMEGVEKRIQCKLVIINDVNIFFFFYLYITHEKEAYRKRMEV